MRLTVSDLIKQLQEYKDFYGNNPVFIYSTDGEYEVEITSFDAFKNSFYINLGEHEQNDL